MENDLKDASKLLDELTNRLPAHVDPALMSSLTLYRVAYLRNVLAHRVRNLSENAVPLFVNNQLIAACLVTRALLETVSLLYVLHRKLISAIDRKEVKQLDEWLIRVALGRRNVDTKITPPNILSALDSISTEYGGVREMYDELSEFCHPNFAGVLASYSRVNDAENTLLLGPNDAPPMPLSSAPYLISLKLAVHYYDKIERNFDAIKNLTTTG